jgi:hypothetical protein
MPKEHYTLYKGKIIRVGDLLQLLLKKKKNKMIYEKTKQIQDQSD